MLEEALKCYNNGWSVLPVKPHEKRPFMTNWLQYTKQRPTPTNIKSWFKDLKGAGLGAVTGKISNIVVIDVEHDSPYKLEQLLKKYPTSLISKTGSGGYHLFYQYPQNRGRIANRVRMLDGVDLRADGGFIVLPPTVHACGGKYEWLQYGVPGKFPEELLQLESQSTTGDNWITDIYKGVAEGGRNQAAASLAGYFYKKGLPKDIIEMLMFEWNEKNDPPLPTQEIHTVINSIEKRHKNIMSFTSVEFIDDGVKTKKEEKSSTFDLMKLNDYIRAYGGDGASYCIEKWLPDKSIIFLVSPPESYKTWMLLDAAISVASGLPFLGEFPVNKKGAVFIVQQEDSHNGMTERLAVIAQAKFNTQFIIGEESQIPLIPDLPIYIHPSRQLRFTNKEILKEIEKQIQEIKPALVIIDPLYSAISNDNYMAGGAEQMMPLKEWRDKYDCSFLIAHHSRKNLEPDSTAREEAWGSQFLNAFQEGGWQIRRSQKLADNEVVVRRHSKVMGNQKLIKLSFDISTKYPMKYKVSTSDYVVEDQEEPTKKPTSNAKNKIYDMLRKKACTQSEICNELGRDISTISRHLKQLETTNMVQKLPDGKYVAKLYEMESE